MLIFGGAEDDPFTLTKPYILVGSVVLLVAILFFFTKLPEVQEETDKEEKMIAPVSGTASMWRHPQFIRAIIAQFCYCAAQTGIFSFFINYVTEVDTSMTNIEASRILAFGGMALFMIGRVCRYGFFVCALSFFFLYVHYVSDNLCTRLGRYGFLYEESFLLYRYGSSRRSLCSNADGIYRSR